MRKALTVLVVGSALSVLASCGSSTRSFVRIVNAAPDAGTIDVTINGNKILTATPYGTGSNYFTEAPGTTISLKIVSSGGVNGSTSATIDTTIGLVNKAYYTISVVGLTVAPSTFTILQTEFGIKVASIAGGTLKLQDELKCSFYIVARKSE